ncbi:polyprenyl synthetase family protein [Neorickettsia risticii]|uniref:Geranyltranstransferase n=1 Tax=Neorickettsia risticii (strain Illinois) TaxID=434131 RepID=C6V5H9_NEORI|nr:polyprenyl synthetase family protein [Neorickettsia risticii]ACT69642.1 putative geranyltranstransferase [Neorickettsia risticii str. Illinois]
MTVKKKLQKASRLIHETLKENLSLFPSEDKLFQAIRYSLLAESSHIRGFLVLELGTLFNIPYVDTIEVAAAIEMIHSFSLIHDDLPALDNSNERRNQPACHIAFQESTAILAGDALLVLAYQILSHYGAPLVQRTSKYVLEMITGQVHDVIGSSTLTADEINKMKSGSLFALSCSSVGHLANSAQSELTVLEAFGYEIGIIFQAVDDIKDGDAKNDPQKSITVSLKKIKGIIDTTFLLEKKTLIDELVSLIINGSL